MKYIVKVAGSVIRPEVGAKAFVEQMQKSSADQQYHTVGSGDTFWDIEKRRGFPAGSMQRANPGVDPRRLRIGQQLNLPAAIKPQQTAAVASPVQAPVNRPQVQRIQFRPEEIAFYNALAYAETGSESDPWIRTKVAPEGGSTAFGPVQITRTKVKDYIERFPKTMAGSTDFYNTTMAPMYQKFVTYGREPNKEGYDRRWDYGGYGIHFTPEQKLDYRDMALRMITEDRRTAYKELPKGSIEDTLKKRIQLWRGVPYEQDPGYYDKVIKHYNDNFLNVGKR